MEIFLKILEKLMQDLMIKGIILFKIDDDVYAFSKDGLLSDYQEPIDCTFIVSKDVLKKLSEKKISPMTAYMTGKIKIKGDMGLAIHVAEKLAEYADNLKG